MSLIENKYLSHFSAIQAFKLKYTFLKKKIIPAFESEFERTLELACNRPLFNLPSSISNQHDSVFQDIDFETLKTPIITLRSLSLEFLNQNKPRNVSLSSLTNLVTGIQGKYKYIPYHGFAHGFGVMHMFNLFISAIQNQRTVLEHNSLFICYLSCLAHDIGHKSKNNSYNIAVKSKYALRSLNHSIMEKHHIQSLFKLLKNKEMDVFKQFDIEEASSARKLIIDIILATDMLVHKEHLNKFSVFEIDSDPKNNLFLAEICIQAADIGNSVYSFSSYLEWARLITQEFDSQTLSESKRGIKINEFMKFSGARNFVDNQLGFNCFIIRHVFSSVI